MEGMELDWAEYKSTRQRLWKRLMEVRRSAMDCPEPVDSLIDEAIDLEIQVEKMGICACEECQERGMEEQYVNSN